jgi:hypothetical protein
METRLSRNKRTGLAASAGAILLSALSLIPFQSAQATVIETNTAVLADSLGAASGSEALTLDYDVDLTGGIYTYNFIVNNPIGDVLLPPNSGSEVVDEFTLNFNAAAPGAVLPGSMSGLGTTMADNGEFGLIWYFVPSLTAGSSSATLSFESDDAPTLGDASASDANAPSPWSSVPGGQFVALPSTVPDTTSTITLFGGAMLLLRWGMKRTTRFSL